MFYSPRSAYTLTQAYRSCTIMSTSIRCRLQLVSGDESRIGWDFKGIDAPHDVDDDHKRKLVERYVQHVWGNPLSRVLISSPSPRTDFVRTCTERAACDRSLSPRPSRTADLDESISDRGCGAGREHALSRLGEARAPHDAEEGAPQRCR